ncbi:MAG: hypothetical protein IJ267_06515 [Bacteroidales bacterium]|nr:hypothetical protein [Bacteroidales bacterium]
MKVSDIVKLMKAGYTPGEIAKLEDPASVLELIAGGVEKDQVDECLSLITSDPENGDPEPEDPEPDDPEPDDPESDNPKPDYEKMYNNLLKKTQKQAMQKDMSGSNPPPKSTDEILKEIAVDYM